MKKIRNFFNDLKKVIFGKYEDINIWDIRKTGYVAGVIFLILLFILINTGLIDKFINFIKPEYGIFLRALIIVFSIIWVILYALRLAKTAEKEEKVKGKNYKLYFVVVSLVFILIISLILWFFLSL